MFAIERRNHAKAAVYEVLCVRDPVDTSIAIDKLERSKRASNPRGSPSFSNCVERLRAGWAMQTTRSERQRQNVAFASIGCARTGVCERVRRRSRPSRIARSPRCFRGFPNLPPICDTGDRSREETHGLAARPGRCANWFRSALPRRCASPGVACAAQPLQYEWARVGMTISSTQVFAGQGNEETV